MKGASQDQGAGRGAGCSSPQHWDGGRMHGADAEVPGTLMAHGDHRDRGDGGGTYPGRGLAAG